MLQQTLGLLPSMVAYWGTDLKCRYANAAYETWFGAAPGSLVGRPIYELLGPALYELNRSHIEAALAGVPQTFERNTVRVSSGYRPSLVHYRPHVVEGVVRGFAVQVTDVTPLKDSERELRDEIAQRGRTAALLAEREAALLRAELLGDVGSWEWEVAADITTWSPGLYAVFGCDPKRLPPSYAEHARLYTGESWFVLQSAVAKALTTGAGYCVDLQYRRTDGRSGWLEARGEAVRDETGRIVGLRGTAQVVTDRRAATEAGTTLALAEGARRDRALLLSCVSEQIRNSLNGVSGFAHLLEGAAVSAEKRSRWAGQIARSVQEVVSLLAAMESPTFELFGGQPPPVPEAVPPAPHEGDSARLATAAAGLAVWRWDFRSDTVLWENGRPFEIFGLGAEALPASGASLLRELVLAEDAELLRAAIGRVLASAGDFHFTGRICRKAQQDVRWVELVGRRQQPGATGMLFVGVMADVTERREREERLRDSEGQLAAILDAIPAPVIVYDEEGTMLHVSRALTQITGYSAEELPTRSAWASLAYRTDDVADIATRVRGVVALQRPASAGERQVRTKSGETRVWQLAAAPAGTDASGHAIVVAVGHDITELKAGEQAGFDDAARKERFLAVLAHELRTPLMALQAAAALVERHRPAVPAMESAAAVLSRQTRHMARLIDDLLDVSRIRHGKIRLALAAADLRAVLHEAAEATQPLMEAAGHVLAMPLPATPVILQIDSARMVQVFTNLLGNAARYTPAGGVIAVSIEASERAVSATVSDSGVGIAPEQLTAIFEMFEQLDPHAGPPNSGLGIGLALVRQLVELHGGSIVATSAGAGQGSSFRVTLPNIPL